MRQELTNEPGLGTPGAFGQVMLYMEDLSQLRAHRLNELAGRADKLSQFFGQGAFGVSSAQGQVALEAVI